MGATTPNMSIPLATPGVDVGPGWATTLNAALTQIDSHDHATIGTPISTGSLNINATLTCNGNELTSVGLAVLTAQTVSALPDATLSLGSDGTDLWYAGTSAQVQLTQLGLPANPTALWIPPANPSANTLITNTTLTNPIPYAFYNVNPSGGSFLVSLPYATTAGQILIFKDTGNATGSLTVTIVTQGSETIDNAAVLPEITSAYGVYRFMSDGANWWIV